MSNLAKLWQEHERRARRINTHKAWLDRLPLWRYMLHKMRPCESPVEQRVGIDLFDNQMVRSRAKTVYYLIAEDGTVAEVGLTDYTQAKVGTDYTATSWTRK